MTVFATGSNPGTNVVSPTQTPVVVITGTNYTYPANQNCCVFQRSNATVAMSDTLPAIITAQIDNEYVPIPNGWFIYISNRDGSAAITLNAPTGTTINGSATLSIPAGDQTRVYSDGVNYWSTTPA